MVSLIHINTHTRAHARTHTPTFSSFGPEKGLIMKMLKKWEEVQIYGFIWTFSNEPRQNRTDASSLGQYLPTMSIFRAKKVQINNFQGLCMKNASNVETSAYLRVGTGISTKSHQHRINIP